MLVGLKRQEEGIVSMCTTCNIQYTHMFETILSSTSGGGDDDDGLLLYFGHLYLPGGHRQHYRGRNVIV